MKVKDLIRMIQQDGWYLDRIKGSHQQYKHQHKKGTVTIAVKPSDDVKKGTENSIMKQAGLK